MGGSLINPIATLSKYNSGNATSSRCFSNYHMAVFHSLLRFSPTSIPSTTRIFPLYISLFLTHLTLSSFLLKAVVAYLNFPILLFLHSQSFSAAISVALGLSYCFFNKRLPLFIYNRLSIPQTFWSLTDCTSAGSVFFIYDIKKNIFIPTLD